ncbi:MAG: GHMP kinase, partial [Epulopiscium sp.]|nr:GHMP kinase [Candidatus Epulonipiscium sp.]
MFVSTPSRICLFGEHQDYLGLEVVASAINLRFYAEATSRQDMLINLHLTGEDMEVEEVIDLSKPIVYENKRDYL